MCFRILVYQTKLLMCPRYHSRSDFVLNATTIDNNDKLIIIIINGFLLLFNLCISQFFIFNLHTYSFKKKICTHTHIYIYINASLYVSVFIDLFFCTRDYMVSEDVFYWHFLKINRQLFIINDLIDDIIHVKFCNLSLNLLCVFFKKKLYDWWSC